MNPFSTFTFRKRYSAAAIAATLFAPPAVAIDSGSLAPDFDLPGGGGTVKLSNHKGKVIYLDFWASWCGPCKRTFPWMNEMHKKYGKDGFQVIAVNVDQKKSDAEKFLAATPAEFTVAFDSGNTTAAAYQPKGMPSSYLIDRNGVVHEVHAGFKESQQSELEHKIQQALAVKRAALK
jgi:cytochrome c biogenesis protein CcmG, thiol:disulfide interchange protein DsbE